MNDENFMKEAIKDAKENSQRFGAILVKEGKIVSKSGERPKNNIMYHAEAQAILNAKDPKGCILYSTCEPCPMCFYMAWAAGISKIFYGATIKDSISIGIPEMDISVKELNERIGNKIELNDNLLREECLRLLKEE